MGKKQNESILIRVIRAHPWLKIPFVQRSVGRKFYREGREGVGS
jgi:hypothetical protein